MRLAIMADVHGNLPALEAVLSDMQQFQPGAILVAGDLVGGPDQNETTRILQEMGAWMIRGNSDTNVLRFAGKGVPPGWQTSKQFALYRWAYENLDPEMMDLLEGLPEQQVVHLDDIPPIRLVHGSPRDPSENLLPDMDQKTIEGFLAQMEEPVLVCGHTHIPWMLKKGKHLAVNPGAVCGPNNGVCGAQYALLSWDGNHWEVDHRLLPYDLNLVRLRFRKSGLLDEVGVMARVFLLTIETGIDIAEVFLPYAYELAEGAGYQDCLVVPDEIWDLADRTFNWDRFLAVSKNE
jgi:putative phosphoesterase